jgi:hypothetical protein
MKLASVRFVFANFPLSAQRSEFFSVDLHLSFHSNLLSSCLLSSYTKKKQYFELERMKSNEARIVAEASANDLLNNAAKVHTMTAEESYKFYLKQEEPKYIPDACIQKMSASEGWLAQTNHLLHTGVTTSQYLEFEHAIRTAEQQHGGPMWTKKYGNLNEVRTAKQRARNTCLRDVAGVGTDGGDGGSAGGGGVDGVSAGGDGGPAAGGGGHAAGGSQSNVIDLVMGSGDTPRIPCPDKWPFTCPFSPQSEIGLWSLGPELGQQKE